MNLKIRLYAAGHAPEAVGIRLTPCREGVLPFSCRSGKRRSGNAGKLYNPPEKILNLTLTGLDKKKIIIIIYNKNYIDTVESYKKLGGIL